MHQLTSAIVGVVIPAGAWSLGKLCNIVVASAETHTIDGSTLIPVGVVCAAVAVVWKAASMVQNAFDRLSKLEKDVGEIRKNCDHHRPFKQHPAEE